MVRDARPAQPARGWYLVDEGFAAQVYGLVVVGAGLAVARPGGQSRWSVFADIVVLALVYSLAHMYADLLNASSRARGRVSRAELGAVARNGFALLRATALPFVAFAVCELFRVRDATSVDVALWVIVGELTLMSWFATGAVRPVSRRIPYVAGATVLGVLLIALKVVTH